METPSPGSSQRKFASEKFAPSLYYFRDNAMTLSSNHGRSQEQERLWRSMLAQSFHPRQWFERDDDRFDSVEPSREETLMWVYKKTEPTLYTVGYYDPSGEWHPEGDYTSKDAAAQRVHFLNGGGVAVNQGAVHDAAKRGFEGR